MSFLNCWISNAIIFRSFYAAVALYSLENPWFPRSIEIANHHRMLDFFFSGTVLLLCNNRGISFRRDNSFKSHDSVSLLGCLFFIYFFPFSCGFSFCKPASRTRFSRPPSVIVDGSLFLWTCTWINIKITWYSVLPVHLEKENSFPVDRDFFWSFVWFIVAFLKRDFGIPFDFLSNHAERGRISTTTTLEDRRRLFF